MKPILLAFLLSFAADAQSITGLQVEHLTSPAGVDEVHPRFSWRVEGGREGSSRTHYQILAATSLALLEEGKADLWDSGKTAGAPLLVTYAGKSLQASSVVFWKTRVWMDGEASVWSAPQRFVTGLIGSGFRAAWISFKDEAPFHKDRAHLYLPPARYYRKSFPTGRKVTRAIAHASALGIYELHLNGRRVGDALFAPGWTDYRKRAYYNTYDLTDLIASGGNTLGAVVADGWYAGYVGYGKLVGYGPYQTGRNIYGKTPALAVQLHLTYDDGSSELITTDGTWKTSTGPEREADFLMGETYDARNEMPGWAANGYDDSKWQPAIPAEENGLQKHPFKDAFVSESREFGFIRPPVMEAYPAPPVRVTEELPAKGVTEIKPGVFVFDLAQNFAGVVRLKITAGAGRKISLRFGEMLHPDGRLLTENLREARATDTYICKGDPAGETWSPRFTFHGFRYVEVTGLSEKPPLDTVTGLVLHSDTPLASGFECSDPMVTRLFQNAVWTQRANWIELPTDCPQRDERLGWTGDAQIYAASAAIHADVAAFFRKWLRELEEARTDEGLYPCYAPYPFAHGGAVHGTAWSDAGVIVPYSIWKATGDPSFFKDHWPAMTKYMEVRKSKDPDLKGTEFGAGWGDWLNLDDPTPHAYVELAYFAHTARLMAEMAAAQGLTKEAEKYHTWIDALRANFRKNHLQPDGSIKPSSQSAYVLALDCGLLTDPEERRKAGDKLAALIRSKAGSESTGITTGFLGTKPLLPVLTSTGHYDLALSLLQSRSYPSWCYEVKNGATTIWERWNSYTTEYGFGGPDGKMSASMNSFSHYSFGAVTEWMMTSLAGIAPATPGYEKILLHPQFPSASAGADAISWVKAHHDAPQGRISVRWSREADGSLLYEAVVPPDTTAELILPKKSPWLGGGLETETRTLKSGSHRFVIR